MNDVCSVQKLAFVNFIELEANALHRLQIPPRSNRHTVGTYTLLGEGGILKTRP